MTIITKRDVDTDGPDQEFYSKLGWQPFPSSHIALHPVANGQKSSRTNAELPRVCPLYAGDLAELCKADEIALHDTLARPHVERSGASIALIPDVTTVQWHHAREEFVANELLGKAPQVKGAIVRGEGGQRVWCIWTRTFSSEQEGNTLHILRIVIEGEVEKRKKSDEFASRNGSEEPNQWQIGAVASILRSACLEAANWAMQGIQLWSPTHLIILAAKQLEPTARIIEREDSIPSLRWHGPKLDPNAELTWIGNEKYGWC